MNKMYYYPSAIANIKGGDKAPNLYGQIKFYQKKGYVLVSANIKCLPTTDLGFFGFHIHQGDSCDGIDFSDSKGHFNPDDTTHPEHAGDLPPLLLCNGSAYQTVATNRFSVADIIGKTVIIHSMPDDFNTQPSGNAGEKIACGIIKKP